MESWIYWIYRIVGAALLALVVVAGRLSLRRRLDQQSEHMQASDPETAQALRRAASGIERGRGASRGFF